MLSVGLKEEHLSKSVHEGNKLAHYARACTDITYKFPSIGSQELMGIAARGNYDLTQHAKHSGKSMEYMDVTATTTTTTIPAAATGDTNKSTTSNIKYIPHVIEPSIGLDRLFLAILTSAYREEIIPLSDTAAAAASQTTATNSNVSTTNNSNSVPSNCEKRTVLSFHPSIAPIKVAVFPLLSNKPELITTAKNLFHKLQSRYMVEYDASGAIGRRYRRADEIGVPYCITVDFSTLDDNTVTVRDRDSMTQTRMKIDDLFSFLLKQIDGM